MATTVWPTSQSKTHIDVTTKMCAVLQILLDTTQQLQQKGLGNETR